MDGHDDDDQGNSINDDLWMCVLHGDDEDDIEAVGQELLGSAAGDPPPVDVLDLVDDA